ncbi:hypothetical protein MD588_03905 [Photobacterium sp. SDRW27]|uniref:hypothetical protein n=1 Tax=Photobacterium obscurum TaxID=2829490 RepID=UPI002243D50B|nr:hypothetical protein [Photobacterium obscurum]MCW8327942.1 hypothetical protein [Photobacterium obscurum]
MFKQIISRICIAVIAYCSSIAGSIAGDDVDALIARAKSAAPAEISDNATVIVNGKEVIKGSNNWICLPNTFPDDGMPMCNDPVWMEMLDALVNKKDFKADRIGISYMLQGDLGAGVSNSDPYHPDAKKADDYVEMGAHLMIIVPEELLKGLSDDPSSGGPYIMWKDTPYRHIMVPISDKPLK